jgi:acyl-CoA synthetase (AMP-forming)/AMP-acid ligase II
MTGLAKRVPYIEGGEILVAAPNEQAFVGYYKNEEATQKKYVRDILRKGDLYLRTGDSLRRDEDGRWFFKDRLGDTYRWKSENVSTTHVANVLGAYPGIVDACVYGVEIPGHDGKAGCVAIFVEEGKQQSFDYADFLRWSQKKLPRFAVPVFVRELGELSLMHNNKQNKLPLLREGIDVDKVKETSKGKDRLLWWPGSLGKQMDKAESYVEFSSKDLESLRTKAAHL